MKKNLVNATGLLILLSAFFLIGCGGSETVETELDASQPITLKFEGQDILFDVTEATVKSGQEVTVELNNVGTLEHSWVLISDRVDPLLATEADALLGANSGVVAGGESTSFTFFAPSPGDYIFVCTIEGHAAAGMLGDFKVE